MVGVLLSTVELLPRLELAAEDLDDSTFMPRAGGAFQLLLPTLAVASPLCSGSVGKLFCLTREGEMMGRGVVDTRPDVVEVGLGLGSDFDLVIAGIGLGLSEEEDCES